MNKISDSLHTHLGICTAWHPLAPRSLGTKELLGYLHSRQPTSYEHNIPVLGSNAEKGKTNAWRHMVSVRQQQDWESALRPNTAAMGPSSSCPSSPRLPFWTAWSRATWSFTALPVLGMAEKPRVTPRSSTNKPAMPRGDQQRKNTGSRAPCSIMQSQLEMRLPWSTRKPPQKLKHEPPRFQLTLA